jgi:hypothetical protein
VKVPSALGLLVLVSFPLVAVAQGCGDDESSATPDPKRRGGLGETCERTDDCEAPLACINRVCSDGSGGNGGGGNGGTGGNPSAGGGGTGGATGGGGTGGDAGNGGAGGEPPCVPCLETNCNTEYAACDSECFAIEGCIETYCRSASFEEDQEGACQVACQNIHTSVAKHVDLAICSAERSCDICGQCVYEPEHNACVDAAKTGACMTEWQACLNDSACLDFQLCVDTCTTAAQCFACDDANPAAGDLYEAYQRCVAPECILTSWISVVCI